jgi:hypothetical protein
MNDKKLKVQVFMGFKFLWVISWVFEIKIKSVKESLSLLK